VGQISAFPIDFAGRPYNTLTPPCERVIRDGYAAGYDDVHVRSPVEQQSKTIHQHTEKD